jgi:hypothetical protein
MALSWRLLQEIELEFELPNPNYQIRAVKYKAVADDNDEMKNNEGLTMRSAEYAPTRARNYIP